MPRLAEIASGAPTEIATKQASTGPKARFTFAFIAKNG
jgi:hypothetical protein